MICKTTEILKSVIDGKRLSDEDALTLFKSDDLLLLGKAANKVRWQKKPDKIVTFIIDRNVNYTNYCVVDCGFCAFYAKPKDYEKGYVLSREEFAQKFEETIAHGGTQILMQGGHHPRFKLDWYEDLLRWAKENFPQLQMHAFSPFRDCAFC